MKASSRFATGLWVCLLLVIPSCDPPGGDDSGNDDSSNHVGTSWLAGHEAFDIGSPTLAELWVDPVNGNDENAGTSRNSAFRTILAAWNQIPGSLTTTGYRINITPGTVAFDAGHSNFYDAKHGTHDYPIILRAADGSGTVTIQGGLNIANVSYLYLLDVTLAAGGANLTWGNNNLHVDTSDHVLLRGVTIAGPVPDTGNEIREGFKANQSEYLYLEDCDIYGGYLTGIDWVSVQHGHILGCRIHGFESDWATYFKGGTAYIVVAGNEYYDCQLGFSAGQTTNFEIMRSPWLHYEVYDIKFVNNILHDIRGNGMGVQGGYNILLAYNTLYRVATSADPAYGMLLISRGGRVCEDTSENGENNADAICDAFLDAGGWSPPPTSPAGGPPADDAISNRNVYVYNNIFYNPPGTQTVYGTLDIHAAVTPPVGSGIPSPALADDHLQIRGNVVFDGGADHLGISGDGSTGCPDANITCNPAQLAADNTINVEPQLTNPGDDVLSPVSGGNVFSSTIYAVPDFTWSDAPANPPVPAGTLSNAVTVTCDGNARSPDRPGAY